MQHKKGRHVTLIFYFFNKLNDLYTKISLIKDRLSVLVLSNYAYVMQNTMILSIKRCFFLY